METLNFWSNHPLVWFIIGVIFALLELVVPGLVLIFFGIGALITALLSWILPIGIPLQIVIFAVFSVFALLIFRKYFRNSFYKDNNKSPETLTEEFIGHSAEVIEPIEPNHSGKVAFKGSQWDAISESSIEKGAMVEIIGKESIKLIVKLKK